MDGTKERQGDFVFTAQSSGEYRFCFNNEMSTFAEKMVDFEIAVRLFPVPRGWERESKLTPIKTLGRERAKDPTSVAPRGLCGASISR